MVKTNEIILLILPRIDFVTGVVYHTANPDPFWWMVSTVASTMGGLNWQFCRSFSDGLEYKSKCYSYAHFELLWDLIVSYDWENLDCVYCASGMASSMGSKRNTLSCFDYLFLWHKVYYVGYVACINLSLRSKETWTCSSQGYMMLS